MRSKTQRSESTSNASDKTNDDHTLQRPHRKNTLPETEELIEEFPVNNNIPDGLTTTRDDNINNIIRIAEDIPVEDNNSNNAIPDAALRNKFSNILKHFIDFKVCTRCQEIDILSGFPIKKKGQNKDLCRRCAPNNKKFSQENGMIPDDIPAELMNLTFLEEMLISKICPHMCIARLRSGGQFGYKNHVIAFPQDLNTLTRVLPRRLNDTGILIVRKEGLDNTHRDYRVRRDVVHNALIWLQQNNPYYNDIEISPNNLSELPTDGVPQAIPTQLLPNNNAEQPPNVPDNSDEEMTTEITAIEDFHGERTEEEQIHRVMNDPVAWPRQENAPTNEYSEPGLFTKCFPTLFPRASADLHHNPPNNLRIEPVTLPQWLKHLMCYKDGRFARHHRFRYYTYNMLQRRRASETGRVFMKRNENQRAMSLDELNELLQHGNKSIEIGLMHFGSNIRGTKMWKVSKRLELKDMIDFIGPPTFFCTCSCADVHWPFMQKLLKRHEEGPLPDDIEIDERERIGRVSRNPHLVSAFFVKRFKLFIEEIINKNNNLAHHWAIFEWQHRGSVHAHCLFWLNDCPFPNPEQIAKNGTTEEKMQLLSYYDKYISAWNPSSINKRQLENLLQNKPNDPQLANPTINPPQPTIHPCRIPCSEIENNAEDKASLIHKVQRHVQCSTVTCLRQKKNSNIVECKAGFPKEMNSQSKFAQNSKNKDIYEYIPARNDPLLNNYPENDWHQIFRANMDIKPVLSIKSLLTYLLKYVTKGEPPSETLQEVTNRICAAADIGARGRNSLNVFIKWLTNSVGRDITAQEVMHHLLELEAYLTSESFALVFLHQTEVNAEQVSNSAWEKYLARDIEPTLSLYEYVQQYNIDRKNRVKNPPVIPRIFPRIRITGPQDPKYETFCQIELMKYKPATPLNPLKSDDQSWSQAMDDYLDDPSNKIPEPIRILIQGENTNSQPIPSSNEFESSQESQPNPALQPDFVHAGFQRQMEQSQPADDYDWNQYYQSLPEDLAQNAFNFIQSHRDRVNTEFSTNADPKCLNTEQLHAYNTIINNINNDNPIHILINGTAGSGKSYVINCLRSYFINHFGANSVQVCAPTGTAAFNVSGTTIHSTLSLPVPIPRDDLLKLRGMALSVFQEKFASTKLLIIDEMSMIGRSLLRCIDLRLRETHPQHSSLPFGKISVCLFGDFGQLPPVMDKPMYSQEPSNSAMSNGGILSFRNFTKAVILRTVERVRGDSEEQTKFRELLSHFRNGEVNHSDVQLLATRIHGNIQSPEEIESFRDAPYLVTTKRDEISINNQELKKIKTAHCKIISVDKPTKIKDVDAERFAIVLTNCLELAKGVKVMLRSNMWVSVGLANGTIGVVHDFLYLPNTSPPSLPAAVCVEFPQYQGPSWDQNNPKVLPIPPITLKWIDKGKFHSRTQIPLCLSYAVTVHKSQGWTREKIIVDIGKKDFSRGLTFVAFSRVKSLDGILIRPLDAANFSLERLQSVNKQQEQRRKIDTYIEQLANST